jgi:hypothetical protein
VLTNANGLGGTPEWIQLSTLGGFPAGQYGATAVFNPDTNRMSIFGGGGFVNGTCTESNAVWILENANGLDGTPIWVNVIAENSAGAPPPRGFHTAIYDQSANRMTVFGGNNDSGVLGDTWTLSNADGFTGTPSWQQLSPTGGTPPRTGHVAGLNTVSGHMTVFAGHSGTCCRNDSWVLSNVTASTQIPTSTVLVSSVNPSIAGQSITLTATVQSSSGSGTPTGTVTFQDSNSSLATVSLISGQATLNLSTLSIGSHSISAVYSGDGNFAGSSGSLTQQVSFGICALYDQTRSVKNGATFPVKLQLCDAAGNDVSSSTLVLHATQITSVSGFSGAPTSPGNANPDADFRFDTSLGLTGGYIFNLSTSGLAPGTYSLLFTTTGDPAVHAVNFGVN